MIQDPPTSRVRRDLERTEHVLAEHVTFEVDGVAHAQRPQVRVLPRVRNDLHVEAAVVHARDGQADSVHRDRALANDRRRERGRIPTVIHQDSPSCRISSIAPGGVDVPLHEVAADPRVDAQRPLEIDRDPRLSDPSVVTRSGLRRHVRVDAVGVGRDDSQTHAVDGELSPGASSAARLGGQTAGGARRASASFRPPRRPIQ